VFQPFGDHSGTFLNAFRAQEPAFGQTWGDRAIAQVNLSRTEAVGMVPARPRVGCGGGSAAEFAQLWPVVCPGALARGGQCLLIPESCAHGFQLLEPGSELLDLHSGA
jgi:dTDP-4-dehydrorhamnose 3,5-epimerase